jgi:hypothetical protein
MKEKFLSLLFSMITAAEKGSIMLYDVEEGSSQDPGVGRIGRYCLTE